MVFRMLKEYKIPSLSGNKAGILVFRLKWKSHLYNLGTKRMQVMNLMYRHFHE